MTDKIKQFTDEFLKKIPDIKVGDTIKVSQNVKEGDKERIQVFEGLVLAIKHGRGIRGTVTVRKIIAGVGVEKTFPFHSPNVKKIEIVSRSKARRAKLYYLRDRVGKKAKLKKRDYVPGEETIEETPKEQQSGVEQTEEKPKPTEVPVAETKAEEPKKEKSSQEPEPKEKKE